MALRRERTVLLGFWVLAALAIACGSLDPPAAAPHATAGRQAMDLARAVLTVALATTLVMGPGTAWRCVARRDLRLAFMPLPGLALLAATAGLAWVLAPGMHAHTTCLVAVGIELVVLYAALVATEPVSVFSGEERRVLGLASLALGAVAARSLWSLGPYGELYGGSIARTLVPEPRPDSAISYQVSALIATGTHPYSAAGQALFHPYNFSARGPLAGMATAPIMLLSGTHPLLGSPPLNPWEPFDAQGFMAYRLAMITFTSTVFLSLWQLVRSLGGARAARFAVLLAITTPFVIDDMWFTWPKLLAASLALLGALCVIERRPLRAGLLVGLGYLVHPSGALALLGIAPIALWPLTGTHWRRPRVWDAIRLALGAGVLAELWRAVNGPFYMQGGFSNYLVQAYPHLHPSIGEWIRFRLTSLADTLVPGYLPAFEGHSWYDNFFGGRSDGLIHFFFQYWTGVPFGFGIVFLPLLLLTVWQAARRQPWPIAATIAFPFVAFWIYWGASPTGLLRENLQAWVLAVIAVIALEQAARGFSWQRSRLIRVVLALRCVEVLAIAVVTTLGTDHLHLAGTFGLSDRVALAAVVVFSGLMVRAVWRETTPRAPEHAGGPSRAARPLDAAILRRSATSP